MGTMAWPKRAMPAFVPSASRSTAPSTMPTSSTVWWSSTSTSPSASTVTSMSECRVNASSIWLKNGTGVSMRAVPAPSRSSDTVICVSLVEREISARRCSVASVMPAPFPFL